MDLLINKVVVKLSRYITRPVNSILNWIVLSSNGVKRTGPLRLGGRIVVRNRGALTICGGTTITSSLKANPVGGNARTVLYVSPGARLHIGQGASLSNVIIFCQESVAVEENVMLGGGVQIYDSNFHSTDFIKRMSRPDPDVQTAPVLVKKGAFVGTRSIILKGVTIGEYSIIAAGSVVIKSIPDGEIWGGNPAKFIKKIAH